MPSGLETEWEFPDRMGMDKKARKQIKWVRNGKRRK